MIHKFISSIRNINHRSTGFDQYLSSVQRHNLVNGPTIEEAKRDFQNTVHNRTSGLWG